MQIGPGGIPLNNCGLMAAMVTTKGRKRGNERGCVNKGYERAEGGWGKKAEALRSRRNGLS